MVKTSAQHSQACVHAIGVIPQDPVLFNASIGYNITYGHTQLPVLSNAQAAQMYIRIMSFPEVYETKVGETGMMLSGGQKQCMAIARAMVKHPKVLLVDEATSALDSAMVRGVLEGALGRLTDGRSCLNIAHRLRGLDMYSFGSVMFHLCIFFGIQPSMIVQSLKTFAEKSAYRVLEHLIRPMLRTHAGMRSRSASQL